MHEKATKKQMAADKAQTLAGIRQIHSEMPLNLALNVH